MRKFINNYKEKFWKNNKANKKPIPTAVERSQSFTKLKNKVNKRDLSTLLEMGNAGISFITEVF